MPAHLPKGQYGLLAHSNVRWLLESEPEVYNRVKMFIVGALDTDRVPVAGPPMAAEAIEAKRLGLPIPLPTIELKLRMVKGNLTGDPGVEVTCSDQAIEEIGRWRMLAKLKSASPASLARA